MDIALFNKSAHELFDGSGVTMKEAQALVTALNPRVDEPVRIGELIRAPCVSNFAADGAFSKKTRLDSDKRRGALPFACREKALEYHWRNICCQRSRSSSTALTSSR
ncbi:MAG: hypothetical protein R3179_06835 [Sedimenticolaceae bacterium]|nr:hypothetical protein [Sedimenticolaceae bacterium]